MPYRMRHATLLDLLSIMSGKRRHRVLRLNPPYTLVQPDALSYDLLRSQLPIKPQVSFVYVCLDQHKIQGYVQARCRWRRRDEWSITTLAAADGAPPEMAEALLEDLVRWAGEEGVIRLFVKLPKDDSMMELFRALGFTHYTNESIWGNLYFDRSGAPSNEPPGVAVRPQGNHDAWDIMLLYSSVTPPAVRRAEELNSRQWRRSHIPRPWFLSQGLLEKSYVWPDQSEARHGLGGHIRLLTGARGHWIAMLFRPDAANRAVCPEALDYTLWKAAQYGPKPVYCGVREYQVEVEGLLEERGFHLLSEQALLVKYIAEPIREARPVLSPLLARSRSNMVPTAKFSAKETD